MRVYLWRARRRDPDPYWVTGKRAAAILGVGVTRLDQLAIRGWLPYMTRADGTRLYRREQLEVVGRSCAARWDR